MKNREKFTETSRELTKTAMCISTEEGGTGNCFVPLLLFTQQI